MMYIVEKLEVLGLKEAVPHCLINTAYSNSQADRFLDSNEIKTTVGVLENRGEGVSGGP